MFTKSEICLLKKSRKDCIKNAEMLLRGGDTSYPSFDDISKATKLIEKAHLIDAAIREGAADGQAR